MLVSQPELPPANMCLSSEMVFIAKVERNMKAMHRHAAGGLVDLPLILFAGDLGV